MAKSFTHFPEQKNGLLLGCDMEANEASKVHYSLIFLKNFSAGAVIPPLGQGVGWRNNNRLTNIQFGARDIFEHLDGSLGMVEFLKRVA